MIALAARMTDATTRGQVRADDLDLVQDLDHRLDPGRDQDQGRDQDPQREGAAAIETTMIAATVVTDTAIADSPSQRPNNN